MNRRVRRIALLLALVSALRGADSSPAPTPASPLDEAIVLFKSRQYPAARAALEKITAAEPGNAAACFYLGETLLRRGDATALDDAVTWLEKAAKIEPDNARYLGAYGGTSLQLADRHRSLSAALRGRDAMERAIQLDPADLDAREGLMQFYERAPWPLGSKSKAAAQLEGIRQRDPDRATILDVTGRADAGDYAAAFRICEDVLAQKPANYVALYQYGRTASLSGQNLDRGLSCLNKCLTLSPPSPASPQPTLVWHRIGVIEERLGRPAAARTAFVTALQLNPGNRQAEDALSRLKP